MADAAATARIWFLYLLECEDGSLYAGISPDPQRRLQQHLDGRGARYTRAHRPQRLVAQQAHDSRAQASSAEYRLKRLRRVQKLAWAAAHAVPPSAQADPVDPD